jgi:hypothetical protein
MRILEPGVEIIQYVIDVFTYWEFQCVFSEPARIRAENKKPRRIGVLGVSGRSLDRIDVHKRPILAPAFALRRRNRKTPSPHSIKWRHAFDCGACSIA